MVDTRRFTALIASLPTKTIVIATAADGSPITTEVHSMFGGSQ